MLSVAGRHGRISLVEFDRDVFLKTLPFFVFFREVPGQIGDFAHFQRGISDGREDAPFDPAQQFARKWPVPSAHSLQFRQPPFVM